MASPTRWATCALGRSTATDYDQRTGVAAPISPSSFVVGGAPKEPRLLKRTAFGTTSAGRARARERLPRDGIDGGGQRVARVVDERPGRLQQRGPASACSAGVPARRPRRRASPRESAARSTSTPSASPSRAVRTGCSRAKSPRETRTAVGKALPSQRSRSSSRRIAPASRTMRVAHGSGSQAPSSAPRIISARDRRRIQRVHGDVAAALGGRIAVRVQVLAQRDVLRRADLGCRERPAAQIARSTDAARAPHDERRTARCAPGDDPQRARPVTSVGVDDRRRTPTCRCRWRPRSAPPPRAGPLGRSAPPPASRAPCSMRPDAIPAIIGACVVFVMNPTRSTSPRRPRQAASSAAAPAPASRSRGRPSLCLRGLEESVQTALGLGATPPSPRALLLAVGHCLGARPATDRQVAPRRERVLGNLVLDHVRLHVGARHRGQRVDLDGPVLGGLQDRDDPARSTLVAPQAAHPGSERAMNGLSGATLFWAQQKLGSRAWMSAPCCHRNSAVSSSGRATSTRSPSSASAGRGRRASRRTESPYR